MKYLGLMILLSAPLLSQDMSTFVDSTHGYVIQYPSFISLGTKPDYPGPIVYSDGKWIIALDDSEIPSDQPNFRSFAISLAILSCAADGPDGSQWAQDVDSAQVKKNKYGITYVELFLKKSETFDSKSKSEIVGPFFVIDISSSNKKQALMLDWRPNWMPTPIQVKACRAIVENIKSLNR